MVSNRASRGWLIRRILRALAHLLTPPRYSNHRKRADYRYTRTKSHPRDAKAHWDPTGSGLIPHG